MLAPAVLPQDMSWRPPRQETLLNGLKVLMWSDTKSDKVSLKLRIHSGSAFDPQGKEGAMKLLADEIFPTQEARDYFAEDLGGSLVVDSNYDYIQINATAKPDQFLAMLDTVANAISNISINKDSTAKLRSAQIARIQELEKSPSYIADQSVAKRLFGTFPYGRPVNGTAASLAKIDLADLIDLKQRFLSADNATLALSGNFDSNLAFRAARRLFGGWLKADRKTPSTFRQPDAPDVQIQSIVVDGGGGKELRYAVRGFAKSDPNYAASQILAEIIKMRLSAKRENVVVLSNAYILPGSIVIALSGASITPLADRPANVIAQILETNISSEEFQSARSVVESRWRQIDAADLWLDVGTYKTSEPKNLGLGVTLPDVQNLAAGLRKAPVASVFVERTAVTNSVPK